MATCPSCEREVSDEAAVCPYDGARLETEAGRQRPVGTLLGAEASPTPSLGSNIEDILADDRPAIEAGTMMGEYKVTHKLGEGGMGEVYAAIHPIIGKKVAIKVLAESVAANREVVWRCVDEARSVNQIGHANIVDVFSFGQHTDGRHFFVMEHLDGCSLEDELEDEPIFSPDKVVDIFTQALDALQAAHDAGIIHRDLKPDNIYLIKKTRHQGVKLLDFGIAKLGGDDENRARTQTGMALGTPDYMSPEQCRGVSVDYRTDIYACGVILYRMFTAHFPFEGEEEILALFMRVLSDPPDLPSKHAAVPEAFEAIILKCLAKDPDDRFASATELSAALSDALESPGQIQQPKGKAKARMATSDEEAETAEIPVAVSVGENAPPSKPVSKDDTDIVPKVGPSPVPTDPPKAAPLEEDLIKPTLRKTQSPKGIPMAAIVGACALAVGVGGFFITRGMASDDSPEVASKQTPPPNPQPIVFIDAGMVTVIKADANVPQDAAQRLGTIQIITNRKDAQVVVDGAIVGRGKSITLRDLMPGERTFVITSRGRAPFQKTLSIVSGENADFVVSLQRVRKTTNGKDPNENTDKPPNLTVDGTIPVDFKKTP